jgi:hypothetical protein
MQIIDSEKEYLVDLKWPEILPQNVPQLVQGLAMTETKSEPRDGQVFQLTGWRGAGWRMIFPEEPAQ